MTKRCKHRSGFARRLAREQARRVLGQPKPTVVHDTAKQPRPKPVIDLAPRLVSYVEPEPKIQASFDMVVHSSRPAWFGGRRGERHGEVTYYSPEVIRHFEYLKQTKGQSEANKYLASVKEGTTTMSNEPLNVGASPAAPTIPSSTKVTGTIEQALKESEERLFANKREITRLQAEVVREELIVKSLTEALKMTTVPRRELIVGAPSTGNSKRIQWKPIIAKLLTDEPLIYTKKSLKAKLAEVVPESSELSRYTAINSSINTGFIFTENDKLKLRESK